MKDADYKFVDEYDKPRHDGKLKCLKDYAMAVAVGVGIGMGAMMFWYEKKPFYVNTEQAQDWVEADNNCCLITKKGKKILDDGFKEIGKRYDKWYDGRIWTHMVDMLGTRGEKVPDNNVKKVLDDILSPRTPMGKLLTKYRGPRIVPEPSQQELDQFEELYQEYEAYQPVIDALIDWNHDDETTREERNKGLYKLLHQ